MIRVSLKLPQRFWDKVRRAGPDDCWPWQGAKNEKGYGLFRINGRVRLTARLVLMSKGIDVAGLVSRHTCDNPPCCNPRHLLAGTHADNVRDCIERKRRAPTRGEHNNFSKLTDVQVRKIRREYKRLPRSPGGYCADGAVIAIANKYGITDGNLYMIVTRRTWRHV